MTGPHTVSTKANTTQPTPLFSSFPLFTVFANRGVCVLVILGRGYRAIKNTRMMISKSVTRLIVIT